MVGHRPNQKRISDIDESFEDIDILLKRLQRSSEKKDSPVPSTTYFEFFFYCLKEPNNILNVYLHIFA